MFFYVGNSDVVPLKKPNDLLRADNEANETLQSGLSVTQRFFPFIGFLNADAG